MVRRTVQWEAELPPDARAARPYQRKLQAGPGEIPASFFVCRSRGNETQIFEKEFRESQRLLTSSPTNIVSLQLDRHGKLKDCILAEFFGGAPVSTWEMRQRRHAEDDALAS
jgi:hypothetical protein